MAHAFRFGVQATMPLPGRSWPDTARQIERWGYSSLLLPDHFGDQLAPLSAISVALASTDTLRAGALVFDNDYRHPLVLAKEMATLDTMFPGRVEFGLGAGWMREDYDMLGLAYDPPRTRVDRFEEAVEVVRAAFVDDSVTFSGSHYQVTDYPPHPRPVTAGGPVLIIGGGGRRVLTIAARHASIVGINPNLSAGAIGPEAFADALPERFEQKLSWVRQSAGERIDDIELNVLCFVVNVTDSADESAAARQALASMFSLDASAIADIPQVLVGTVDELANILDERRARWGFSYYVVQADAAASFAPVVARLAGT